MSELKSVAIIYTVCIIILIPIIIFTMKHFEKTFEELSYLGKVYRVICYLVIVAVIIMVIFSFFCYGNNYLGSNLFNIYNFFITLWLIN